MLVCPIYERERKNVEGREIVIIGFRSIPQEEFQGVVDVIKEFGAKYIPEKRVWFIKQKAWGEMVAWFEDEQYFIEADEDYEAVRRAL